MRAVVVWFLVLAFLSLPRGADALEDISFDAFFGKWSGDAVAETPPGGFYGYSSRDLDIVIGPKGNGFNVSWTTVMYLEDAAGNPETRRRSASIDFVPTQKKSIFRGVGLSDPMAGGYVWARIEGQTLRVYSMRVDNKGRYNVQIYDRTLTGSGMELYFQRIQEGQPFRVVKGRLVKTGN